MHWNLSCDFMYALTAFSPLQIGGATTQTLWPLLHVSIYLFIRKTELLSVASLYLDRRSVPACESELWVCFPQADGQWRPQQVEAFRSSSVKRTQILMETSALRFHVLKETEQVPCLIPVFLCTCVTWLTPTHLFILIRGQRWYVVSQRKTLVMIQTSRTKELQKTVKMFAVQTLRTSDSCNLLLPVSKYMWQEVTLMLSLLSL